RGRREPRRARDAVDEAEHHRDHRPTMPKTPALMIPGPEDYAEWDQQEAAEQVPFVEGGSGAVEDPLVRGVREERLSAAAAPERLLVDVREHRAGGADDRQRGGDHNPRAREPPPAVTLARALAGEHEAGES